MKTKFSKLNLSFVDQKMNPYKAKRVVISDGVNIQEYHNVEKINSEIPSISSMRVVWTSGEYDTMEQIPLQLDSGREYEFNFYCLDRSTVVEQTTPYILFEEKGADTKLDWKWNEKEKRISGTVNLKKDKLVDIAVWVDTKLMQRPISAAKSSLTAASSLDWSICFPPNINLTGSFGAMQHLDNKFEHEFVKVSDSLQFAGIRKANYKDHIIDDFNKEPFQCELKKLDGKVIKPEYYWPQHAVEQGFYHLKPQRLPKEFVTLALPLKVELDKVSLYEFYPPKISESKPFSFDIIAEYYHARAKVYSINHDEKRKMLKVFSSAQGDLKYSNGYFGAFVIPTEHKVKSIKYTDGKGIENDLIEFKDYIYEQQEKLLYTSVRVPLDAVSIELYYV